MSDLGKHLRHPISPERTSLQISDSKNKWETKGTKDMLKPEELWSGHRARSAQRPRAWSPGMGEGGD